MRQIGFPCSRCDSEIYNFTLSAGDGLIAFRYVCHACRIVNIVALASEDVHALAKGQTICVSINKPREKPAFVM